MRQLRARVGISVAWLLLVSILDSSNLIPAIALSTEFYIGTAIIVLVSFLVPMQVGALITLAAAVIAFYVLGPMLMPGRAGLGLTQPLAVVELISLEMTVIFAYVSSRALHDAERVFGNLVLPPGYTRLVSFADFVSRLEGEIGRARRHKREISLAVMTLDAKQNETLFQRTVQQIHQQLAAQAAAKHFGLMLGGQIRETDVIAQHPKTGQFLLLTPETAPSDATMLVERLAQRANIELGGDLKYSISSFPELALTSESLLEVVTAANASAAWNASVVPPTPIYPAPSRRPEAYAEQPQRVNSMSDASLGD